MATRKPDEIAKTLRGHFETSIQGHEDELDKTLEFPYDQNLCHLPMDTMKQKHRGYFTDDSGVGVLADRGDKTKHYRFVLSAWFSMLSQREQLTRSFQRTPSALYLGPFQTSSTSKIDLEDQPWPIFRFQRVVAANVVSQNYVWTFVGNVTHAVPRTLVGRIFYWDSLSIKKATVVGNDVVQWLNGHPGLRDWEGSPRAGTPKEVRVRVENTTSLTTEDFVEDSIERVRSFEELLLRLVEISAVSDLDNENWTIIENILVGELTGEQWRKSILGLTVMPYWSVREGGDGGVNLEPLPIPLTTQDATEIRESFQQLVGTQDGSGSRVSGMYEEDRDASAAALQQTQTPSPEEVAEWNSVDLWNDSAF